jgi:hypothetical protein
MRMLALYSAMALFLFESFFKETRHNSGKYYSIGYTPKLVLPSIIIGKSKIREEEENEVC